MVAHDNTTPLEATQAIVESETPVATGMEDHKEYFWDVVRFKIGSARFQLPLYRFLEESDFFAAHYGLCDNPCKDGFTTSVVELDVDLHDFECFLKAFIPRSPAAYHTKPILSKLEWISVLKLATKWKFNDLRKTAIDALHETQDLTTMERTMLAKEYCIPAWLMQGYEAFILEMQALDCMAEHGFSQWTKEDASKIGWDVVVELQGIVIRRYRSMLQKRPSGIVEDHILGSLLLNEEYDAMKETSQAFRTREEIRKIEEKRREAEEMEEEKRRAVAELEEDERRLAEEDKARQKAEEEAAAKRIADEERRRAVEAEQKSQEEKELEAKQEKRRQLLAALNVLDEEISEFSERCQVSEGERSYRSGLENSKPDGQERLEAMPAYEALTSEQATILRTSQRTRLHERRFPLANSGAWGLPRTAHVYDAWTPATVPSFNWG